MNDCKTCERRNKERCGCAVFKPKPENCWAWTDDPKWGYKAAQETEKYRLYKDGKIGEYWRDDA